MTAVPPNTMPGMPPPPPPSPAQDGFSWPRFFMFAGVIALFAGGAFYFVLKVAPGLSFEAATIGVAAAILPVPVLVACLLWLGRYNPKPPLYLLFSFGWGACVATAAALFVNTQAAEYLAGLNYSGLDHIERPGADLIPWSEFFTATAVAPIIEELMKALGPALIFWISRRQFTGVIDGIVYFGLSAVGFAMVENVLYLGRGFDQGDNLIGTAGGFLITGLTFTLRILISGFAHPLFSSMAGIGFGLSRRRRGFGRWLIPIAMLLLAIVLHSAWNVIASLGMEVLLAGYLSVMMPIFFTAVGGALWIRAAEARLSVELLSDYVDAGLLSPPEIAALATYRRRASARLWARRVAGDNGFKAMREYQHLATQLALLRDGMRIGSAEPDDYQREHALLSSLLACRAVFAGADPAMPRAIWDGRYYQIQFPDGSVRQVNPPPQPVMPIPIVPRPMPMAPPPGMPWRPGY